MRIDDGEIVEDKYLKTKYHKNTVSINNANSEINFEYDLSNGNEPSDNKNTIEEKEADA